MVQVRKAKFNVNNLLLAVRSLRVKNIILFIVILMRFLFFFVSIRFLPFWVEIIAFASFSSVELKFFLFPLLSLPFVECVSDFLWLTYFFLFSDSVCRFSFGSIIGRSICGLSGFVCRGIHLVLVCLNVILVGTPVMRSTAFSLVDGFHTSSIVARFSFKFTFSSSSTSTPSTTLTGSVSTSTLTTSIIILSYFVIGSAGSIRTSISSVITFFSIIFWSIWGFASIEHTLSRFRSVVSVFLVFTVIGLARILIVCYFAVRFFFCHPLSFLGNPLKLSFSDCHLIYWSFLPSYLLCCPHPHYQNPGTEHSDY